MPRSAYRWLRWLRKRGWTCDEIADHTDLSRMGRSTSASGTRSMVRRLCATNPVGARGIEVVR
ncbi:hypothetical protein BMAPRL20_1570 [Burkholderia mallei PRL-20]|uniref:Uncharacterized protein n=1 Tax=Burkholderia mallei (strain NCTC 10229) TaxID=412022 RepID=A2S1R5_BURM9|nr:hypothetical protein BMA10229_2088 [Burkholderia mallei NCTC 10229]ABO02814.1 hypothetical protein BMA10247_A0772 [Burkholderia mallei NCTC 10247]EES46361.1 hypothetical protein BMAPRL20_1570 [Burkholderia mallei PRL-20]